MFLRRLICVLPGVSQYPRVTGHTWLPPRRLKSLERHVAEVERLKIPGDIIECGVAEGGSAALLGLTLDRLSSTRTLYLLDTFEGLPPPTRDDADYDDAVKWTGRCRGTVDEVRSLFSALGVDGDRTRFIKGMFQDTLPGLGPLQIAVAHLDGDWYESTLTCLTAIWPALSVGGVIQLDDYGTWKGCRAAVDHYFSSKTGEFEMFPIDESALLVKRQRAGSS
jgi:O-methyltransferase